jgi:peptidoglycan/LPS O-acetylase OafA/YrhL
MRGLDPQRPSSRQAVGPQKGVGLGARAGAGRRPDVHHRIDDIEVLRAFAIGLVLVEHLHRAGNLIPWIPPMVGPIFGIFDFWSGVDLFLAISGFVIARSLLPKLAEAHSREAFVIATLRFWIRRAWRLLPSAWLWLTVILVCSVAFNRSGAFETFEINFRDSVAAALNVANFRMAHVFQRLPIGSAAVYWSLSLEEQFYIILPLLVYFTRQRLSLALALIVVAQVFTYRSGFGANVLLNLTRSDALSLGVLLAIWSGSASYRGLEPKQLMRPAVQLVLPLIFIVIFAALSGPAFPTRRFTVGLIALLSAAIVWLASYDGDYIFPPGLIKRLMCWMGARSYGIYLIQMPVFRIAREIWFRLHPSVLQPSAAHAIVLVATAFPLIFVLADLNYRFVELPLRRHGAHIADNLGRRDRTAVIGLDRIRQT